MPFSLPPETTGQYFTGAIILRILLGDKKYLKLSIVTAASFIFMQITLIQVVYCPDRRD
ncbi:hypothetical protein D082_14800 [Synechocystis sp. PCC 6714]|nr:hypothetical protein D082_14800 [Synechocystis sp. PCC 6714]